MWCFAFTSACLLAGMPHVYPRFMYDESWPIFILKPYRYGGFVFMISGYYIGNVHESYYACNVLHNYFQMNILTCYIRKELGKYKEKSLKEKVFSHRYQKDAVEVFRRSFM